MLGGSYRWTFSVESFLCYSGRKETCKGIPFCTLYNWMRKGVRITADAIWALMFPPKHKINDFAAFALTGPPLIQRIWSLPGFTINIIIILLWYRIHILYIEIFTLRKSLPISPPALIGENFSANFLCNTKIAGLGEILIQWKFHVIHYRNTFYEEKHSYIWPIRACTLSVIYCISRKSHQAQPPFHQCKVPDFNAVRIL